MVQVWFRFGSGLVQAGQEASAFCGQDFSGRAEGGQGALLQDGNFSGGGEGISGVVGDDEGLDLMVREPGLELGENLVAGFGIEGGEGFVQEQEPGHRSESAGEGDALGFSAGEVSGPPVGELRGFDEFKYSFSSLLAYCSI